MSSLFYDWPQTILGFVLVGLAFITTKVLHSEEPVKQAPLSASLVCMTEEELGVFVTHHADQAIDDYIKNVSPLNEYRNASKSR